MDPPGALPLDQLCAICEDMYVSYNAAATTPDTHMDERLAAHQVPDEKDRLFLRQVFYGLIRYKKLLHVLIQAFYFQNSSVASRSDINTFTLFAFFTIIRLQDLGFGPYRRLVLSQDGQKMLVLLHFIFDEEMLNNFCRDEWMKLYDAQYVDNLITNILAYLPELDDMIKSLEHKVYLSKKKEEDEAAAFSGKGAASVTVPKPFKLSESRPPLIEPEYIQPDSKKAKPAPPRKPPGTLNKQQQEFANLKEQNRRTQQLTYSDPNKQPFKLLTQDRPSNLDQIKAQVEAKIQEECPFKLEEKAKPPPPPPAAHVRLNTAAILREDAVYKKKQEQEAERIKLYEADLRDDSEFRKWQTDMRVKDDQDRMDAIEKRRAEMEAEGEAAKELRSQRETEKVQKMREEAQQIQEQLRAERAAEEESNRERRDIIIEARQGVKVAVEKLEDAKKARATELMKEKEDNARRLAEERALEMVRKQDLIRQLKAIEAIPISEVEKYDPTTTKGQGLLEEMSLRELRERLEIMKNRKKQDEIDRRCHIVANRQKKEGILVAKAANITRIRDMANAQAALRRENVKQNERLQKMAAQRKCEDEMLVLHERLEAKHEAYKQEQLRLAAEEKAIKFEQTKAAASKGAVEEKNFKELRRGQARELKQKQVVTKAAAIKDEAGKVHTSLEREAF
mmetsp:Transcript_5900/g.11252  ORF Transcript_5900/g.11252 Transcript_5900/m.11252 type:complete len:678 (-) Transcript_5900:239-2272(-)